MSLYQNTEKNLQNRFIRYAKIDTQSDPSSTSYPSTLKQKTLAKILVAELSEIGIELFIGCRAEVHFSGEIFHHYLGEGELLHPISKGKLTELQHSHNSAAHQLLMAF